MSHFASGRRRRPPQLLVVAAVFVALEVLLLPCALVEAPLPLLLLPSPSPALAASAANLGRRALLLAAAGGTVLGVGAGSGPAGAAEPSQDELTAIAGAFAAMAADPERPGAKAALEAAEATLTQAIAGWEGPLNQSKAEQSMLRLGRARARVMQNDLARGTRPEKAKQAVGDLDVAIRIMEDDFRRNPSKAFYSEYPDALVRRGLAKEEIKAWQGAVDDYSKAVALWRPLELAENNKNEVNPLVLNFRGNALSQLGKFTQAVSDYEEASQIFFDDGQFRQASISRANAALALYGDNQLEEAVQTMQSIVKKDPGVTDVHVALAAVYWSMGDVSKAESEWQFACDRIDTGCQQYKDAEWIANIRRWPPNLAQKLNQFIDRSR